MNTRITADLEDPALLKLLKLEAAEKGAPVKKVLIDILRKHFSSKLELRALMQSSSSIFTEWNDPENEDYDRL